MLTTMWLLGLLLAAPGEAALDCTPLAPPGGDLLGEVRHARGLLWRVQAPGGAQSVLLGTMHIADPRVMAILEQVQPRLDAAAVFVAEVDLDIAAISTLQGAMFYAGDRNLREVIGPELFDHAAPLMARYGLPREVVARMKPWAVFTTLSLPAGEPGMALDLALTSMAQAAGKEVVGLETVAEQVAVFEGLSELEQTRILRQMACHYTIFQAAIERMIDLYAARDLAALAALALRHSAPHGEAFLDALLWQRNERMLERLEPVLAAGDAFVAVGALHLPGTRGLLQGLERRGYRVEALY
ncbi:MAG: TraB/GumN family protein [Gammaproteobacteria bacterium]